MYKALVFALFGFLLLPGGVFRSLLFIIIACILYNPFDGIEVFSFFSTLLMLLFAFLANFSELEIFFVLCAALVFFAILSLKHTFFHAPEGIAFLIFTALAFGLLAAAFFEIIGALFFIIFIILLVFGLLRAAVPQGGTERALAGFLAAFVAFELIIMVRLLPIGNIPRALFVLASLVVTLDCIIHILLKRCTRTRALYASACGAAFSFFVLLSAPWLPF